MIRSMLRLVAGTALVIGTFWNIWSFNRNVANLPPRELDEIVIRESQFKGIREKLTEIGYRSGTVAFITNRDLDSGPRTDADDKRWYQAQYAMVPWILLREKRAVSGVGIADDATTLVMGDFWEGEPPKIPDNLHKLYDSGGGLVLFKRELP